MEEVYKIIFEDTLAGYWDWNIRDNSEYLSPKFKSMFGYEDHELENTPETWQRLIFPEDLDKVLTNYNEHVSSKGAIPYKNEVRYKHKDGSTVWVECTGRVIEWDGDEPIRMVGCHLDITKQKRAESQLKKIEELLNKTNEAAKVGGWEVDLVAQKVEWTKVTRHIHEVEDDYVPGLDTGIEFYKKGENRDAIAKAVENAIKKNIPFDLELQIITAKNNTKWIRTIGQPERENDRCVRIYGSFQDITAQKRTEDDLKLSEVRFEDAFEYSAIGVALVSPEGKWLRVNKQLTDILGYGKEELLSKTFQDITYADDLDADLDYVQQMLEGKLESYQMEKRYVHKYGHIVWVLLSVSLVWDKDGKPLHFISHIQDVTEEKNAKEELDKANQSLIGLYNAMTDVSVISTTYDGIIQRFSKGSERLLGYTADEMINKTSPAIIHVEEEVVEHGKVLSKEFGREISGFEVFVAYAKQGKPFSKEWTYVRKDGTTFPVQLVITAIKNKDGKIDGFLGIATDISAIKNAQNALKESERKYRDIFENVQDVFYQTDYEGVVTEISPSIYKYSGSTREEVIGQHVSNFYHNYEDRENLMNELLQKGKVNDFEVRLKDINGRLVYASVNAHPLLDENGIPIGVEGSMRDISDRKEKEIELSNTLDIISEQNRRLFNFAHIVSHNLRSHSGNLELLLTLLAEAKDEDEIKTYQEHLRSVSVNLSDTIAHLNEVVTIQTNINQQRKDINLYEAVEKTISALVANIKATGVIIENRTPKDIVVNYNEAYMDSILLNLISNGIKYRAKDRTPKVEIEAKEEGGKVMLDIADNGVGIDMKRNRDKLFGMYKTFHGNEDAKGIGLFITKNQIESMGGNIIAESELGVGTTFKIQF